MNPRTTLIPRLIRLTRHMPAPLLLGSRPAVGRLLASAGGWRTRVRRSMTAGLGPEGFTSAHVDQYFAHVADLLAYSALVYRSGVRQAGLERYLVTDPGATDRYREALAGGKGALMVCPHLINHEIAAGFTTDALPITVLARKAPEPEYEALKQRWYSALGVEVVHRPRKDEKFGSLAETTAALRALRRGRVLALTPDLIQKSGSGIAVRFLGRPVELPAGPFFLAVRTGAPLIPAFIRCEGGRYHLWNTEPLSVRPSLDRDAAVAAMAQEWTTQFEQFLREHPDMWQFWLDKRWSRWLDQA